MPLELSASQDRAELILERKRQQARTAAVIEGIHLRMQGHSLSDGLRNFEPAFLENRVVVPLAGLAVEMGGVEFGGLGLGHGDTRECVPRVWMNCV